jgi:hypothetical protein
VHRYLLLTLLFMVSGNICADFYVDDGEYVRTVHGDENQFQADEWQIRLYKRSDATTGDWHWGVISAKNAADAMQKLKDSQDMEEKLETWTGEPWGEFTNFNPLGPVAILGRNFKQKNVQNKAQQVQDKLSNLWETHKKLHQTLLVKGSDHPFITIDGSINEYADHLRNLFKMHEKLNRITESASDSEGHLLQRLSELSFETDKSQKKMNAHLSAGQQKEQTHPLTQDRADSVNKTENAENRTDSLQNEKNTLLAEQLQLQAEQLRMQNELLRLQIEATKAQIQNVSAPNK